MLECIIGLVKPDKVKFLSCEYWGGFRILKRIKITASEFLDIYFSPRQMVYLTQVQVIPQVFGVSVSDKATPTFVDFQLVFFSNHPLRPRSLTVHRERSKSECESFRVRQRLSHSRHIRETLRGLGSFFFLHGVAELYRETGCIGGSQACGGFRRRFEIKWYDSLLYTYAVVELRSRKYLFRTNVYTVSTYAERVNAFCFTLQ